MNPHQVTCVAPVFAADVRNYIRATADAGLLRKLVTGAACHADSPVSALLRRWDALTGQTLYRRTEARRMGDEVPRSVLEAHPLAELVPLLWGRLLPRAGPHVDVADRAFAAIDLAGANAVCRRDRLVIGREDACLRSFLVARRAGASTLYDLPIAHHAAIREALVLEEARFPNVSTQGRLDELYSPRRRARKDAELAAADHVLVASDYVRAGLLDAGTRADNITRVPYGCDQGREYRRPQERRPVILYVGHLSLRKGIPRLLGVWKRLGGHRTHVLRLIGRSYLSQSFLNSYSGMYEHVPHIPRSALWSHYASAAAFVFPSACDGFGLVLNEALSSGTPVIASNHTGAPGFVTHGVEGLIYEHGNDEALATQLEQVLSFPSRTAEMSGAAYELAQRWGWNEYRAEVHRLIVGLLDRKPDPGRPSWSG